MDLIIKNLEKLQDYHTKEGKHPIEKLVLDFDKLSEMKDFTMIFEESCEKYKEPTLKEATERMMSEFDATGKDVKIFMNERVIKC